MTRERTTQCQSRALSAQPFKVLAALSLVGIASAFYLFTPDCLTVSELRVVRDTPEASRLIIEQGRRDSAVDSFWREPHPEAERLHRVTDLLKHPERYTVGRKEFSQALAREPVVLLPAGTYLFDFQTSAAKCDDQPLATAKFRKVRVASGPLRGTKGWTCGPMKPLIEWP